jgi:hypothetical protein
LAGQLPTTFAPHWRVLNDRFASSDLILGQSFSFSNPDQKYSLVDPRIPTKLY